MISKILSLIGQAIGGAILLIVLLVVALGTAGYFLIGPFIITTLVLLFITKIRGGNSSKLMKEVGSCFILACWQAVMLGIAGVFTIFVWGSLGSILFETMLYQSVFLKILCMLVALLMFGLYSVAFYIVSCWCTGEFSIIARLNNATKR